MGRSVKGKRTPGSGRRKGIPNRKTELLEELVKRLDVNPFEVLCLMAKGDWKALGYDAECYFTEKPDGAVKMGYVVTPEMRLHGAKEACRYLYPIRKQVEVSNPEGSEGFKVVLEDYTGKK